MHDVESAVAGREEPVAALREPFDVELNGHFLAAKVADVLARVESGQGRREAIEIRVGRLRDDVDVLGAPHVAVRGYRESADHQEVDTVVAQHAE